jgi:hypothetical protein
VQLAPTQITSRADELIVCSEKHAPTDNEDTMWHVRTQQCWPSRACRYCWCKISSSKINCMDALKLSTCSTTAICTLALIKIEVCCCFYRTFRISLDQFLYIGWKKRSPSSGTRTAAKVGSIYIDMHAKQALLIIMLPIRWH